MTKTGKYYWDVMPEMYTSHLTTYCSLLCVISLHCHLLFIPISHSPSPFSSLHRQHTVGLYFPTSHAVRGGHMTELSPGQYTWRWYSGLAHKTSMHSLTTGWAGGWNEPQGDLEGYIFKTAKPLEVSVPKWLHGVQLPPTWKHLRLWYNKKHPSWLMITFGVYLLQQFSLP